MKCLKGQGCLLMQQLWTVFPPWTFHYLCTAYYLMCWGYICLPREHIFWKSSSPWKSPCFPWKSFCLFLFFEIYVAGFWPNGKVEKEIRIWQSFFYLPFGSSPLSLDLIVTKNIDLNTSYTKELEGLVGALLNVWFSQLSLSVRQHFCSFSKLNAYNPLSP